MKSTFVKRKPIKFIKLKKVYDDFGTAMQEIITCKPQLKRIILPEEYHASEDVTDITMEEFFDNFPNIIATKNPLETDENGKLVNRLWEFHLSSHKFHIKTDNYFVHGSINNYEEISHSIFSLLREADKLKPSLIIIEGVRNMGLGMAINNRLIRSCSHNYINV